MEKIKVLYHDRNMFLAVKPVGMLSEGTGETISDAIKEQWQLDFAEPVNRLDRVCGGIMLVSVNRKMTGKLSELVSGGEYHKTYLAVVDGQPDEKGTLEDILYHDRKSDKTYVVKNERKGAKKAILEYELIESVNTDKGTKSLVKIHLVTGRTHQIRVQFASRKMPLCGDGKYGSRDNGCTCALWSQSAGFVHPVTGKTVEVSENPPKTYPWSMFAMTK